MSRSCGPGRYAEGGCNNQMGPCGVPYVAALLLPRAQPGPVPGAVRPPLGLPRSVVQGRSGQVQGLATVQPGHPDPPDTRARVDAPRPHLRRPEAGRAQVERVVHHPGLPGRVALGQRRDLVRRVDGVGERGAGAVLREAARRRRQVAQQIHVVVADEVAQGDGPIDSRSVVPRRVTLAPVPNLFTYQEPKRPFWKRH